MYVQRDEIWNLAGKRRARSPTARHIAPNMYIFEMNSAETAVCGERSQLGPTGSRSSSGQRHKSSFFFFSSPSAFNCWQTVRICLTYTPYLVFKFTLSFPARVKIIRNWIRFMRAIFIKKETHDFATTRGRTVLTKIFIRELYLKNPCNLKNCAKLRQGKK